MLKTIKKSAPSVKIVVITSSFAAMMNAVGPPKTYPEEVWNPMTWNEAATGDGAAAYRGSKALAERSAWDFVKTERPHFQISAVNPALVLGPIMNNFTPLESVNTSNQPIGTSSWANSKTAVCCPPTSLSGSTCETWHWPTSASPRPRQGAAGGSSAQRDT